MFVSVQTTAEAKKIDCNSRIAPVLCKIKQARVNVNHWRTEAGNKRYPLHHHIYSTDRDQRIRILAHWRERLVTAKAFYESIWQWFRTSGGSCIHHKESVDWHDPGSPGGGMQFMIGTWLNSIVRGYQFAPSPGTATKTEQVRGARRLVKYDGGWHEWSTHGLCGL